MTARPMTEGERAEALEAATHLVKYCHPDSTAVDYLLARALLSTSAAVRGMREALEKIARQTLSVDMSVDDQLGGDFEGAYNYMIEDARAALEPGEDEQATRADDGPAAPTDRL